ncbi:MAG: hypothetical protein IKZ64_01800 [Alphaproteobacteria bacterium]|nr:hypothetical protein [Alphaproteobacteria bacterium]
MKIFGKNYDDKKVKKIVYTAIYVAIALWFVYRFVMVAVESRMDVFNPIRVAQSDGVLVETMVAKRQDDFIKIPIDIKNNRAYVSGDSYNNLKAGQKVESGEIVSVSSSIDLDTGMHVVRTRGAGDGVRYVSIKKNGYFVPLYAVRNGSVMVKDGETAVARNITIVAKDSEYACVVGDLQDGDVIILSKVTAGQKINVK